MLKLAPKDSPAASADAASKSPEVDVIILSWNRVDETIAAIGSALRQTKVSPKIWVVDQGSDEAQLQDLQKFTTQWDNVSLLCVGFNTGVPGGRNIASRLGSAEVIVSIDNDAEFHDGTCLARTVERFTADPRLGVLGFRIENFYTRTLDLTSWNYPQDPSVFADSPFAATRFVGAGHALRRAAFEAAGSYDDGLHFMEEEKDLSYRILDLGYTCEYTPDIVVLHKVSPESRVRWSEGRMYYLCRNVIYPDYKFYKSWWRKVRLSWIFLHKAAKMGFPRQGITGILAGHRRGISHLLGQGRQLTLLSKRTRDYIWENEGKYHRTRWISLEQGEADR